MSPRAGRRSAREDVLASEFFDAGASDEGHGPFRLGTEVGEHLIDTSLTGGTDELFHLD